MSRFTVQMTFAAPALIGQAHKTCRLPGSIASIRWIGSDGLLAVSASRVAADSANEAAMIVQRAVRADWGKGEGALKMLSWRAHRDRVLVGALRKDGQYFRRWPIDPPPEQGIRIWNWDDDGDDDAGGSAGVREPRRPLPGPGSMHAALELSGPDPLR